MSNENVMAGLAFGGLSTGVNNMIAQQNASLAYRRQKRLMVMQNEMNNANQVNAPINQVEGLRMAGFNPAMVAGAGSQAGATVSQGNADMPQTVPFNPQDALIMAQIDNVKADTDVKKAQVPDYNASVGLKVAETLYKNTSRRKVDEEARNIENINRQYADQNQALGAYGQIMAQKWQSSSWYSSLAPDTKDTIDALASGEIPMSVGAWLALERTIETQKNLSDADRAIVKNAFDNAISDAMFNDEAVMNAIAQEPRDKQKVLYKHIDEIEASIKKINAELPNIVQTLKNLKSQKDLTDVQVSFEKAKEKAFKAGDLDYLKSQGEYGKWLEKYAEDRLSDLFKMAPAIAGGRAIGSSMKVPQVPESKPMIFKPTASDYDHVFPSGDRGKPWWK